MAINTNKNKSFSEEDLFDILIKKIHEGETLSKDKSYIERIKVKSGRFRKK